MSSKWDKSERVRDAVTVVRHGETDKTVLELLREWNDNIDT